MVDYDIVRYILIGYWAFLIIFATGLLCYNIILNRRVKKNYEDSIEALKMAKATLTLSEVIAFGDEKNTLTSEEN